VKYTVRLNPDLPTGAQIKNVAYITFDFIETIGTDQLDPHDPSQGTDPDLECFSTVDAVSPTSSVNSLPAVVSTSGFMVNWSGTDDTNGSGVATYTIYVSANDGPYTVWLKDTPDTNSLFTGTDGATYRFRSEASDHVGNKQLVWSDPSAAVTVDLPVVITSVRRKNADIAITWNSRPSREYQVWKTDSLSDSASWTNITDYIGASGYTLSFTNNLDSPATFFRIKARDKQ